MNKDGFFLRLTFYALRQEAPCFFIGADTKHGARLPADRQGHVFNEAGSRRIGR
jgi:hypothetical protein